jgi:thioesterase domain-containing protein
MTLPAIGAQDLQRLERLLHEEIPISRAMGVTVNSFDAQGLTVGAPLALNLNHKQTVFGGSLNSFATLACWSLLTVLLADESATIVIQDSRIDYLAPAERDVIAVAPLPETRAFQQLRLQLLRRGRARIALNSAVYAGAIQVSAFEGRFVVMR